MDNTRLDAIINSFQELSKDNKRITLTQVINTSHINDPEREIEILRKKGIIIQIGHDEFMWV